MKNILYSSLFLLAAAGGVAQAQTQAKVTSILQVMDRTTGQTTVVAEFPYLIEAPNWTTDGQWLIYNSGGRLYRLSPSGKTRRTQPADAARPPETFPTMPATCQSFFCFHSSTAATASSPCAADRRRKRPPRQENAQTTKNQRDKKRFETLRFFSSDSHFFLKQSIHFSQAKKSHPS